MSKIATFSDLVLFAYNELSEKDHLFFEKEMKTDSEMKKDYNGIVSVKKILNTFHQEPSEDVINKLMNYSSALNCFKLPLLTGDTFVLVN